MAQVFCSELVFQTNDAGIMPASHFFGFIDGLVRQTGVPCPAGATISRSRSAPFACLGQGDTHWVSYGSAA